MSSGSALEVQGISKAFGPTPVLESIDLTVADTTITAILGPSGCGKTTLLRLVAGFERPDAGTITIAGRPVFGARRSVPPNRRDLGYVAQEGALFPHLTVRANIAFGLTRSLRRAQSKRQRVGELLELVGLDQKLATRAPHELSGGQQQRVALARALATRPAILLLDEPFSSLDAAARVSTRTAVAQALQAEGVATLLVTHDQAEALSMADQIAVMVAGRFRQVGTPSELYRRPTDLDSALLLGSGTVLTGTTEGSTALCALGRLPIAAPVSFTEAAVFLRPEQLAVERNGTAVVTAVGYLGADYLITARLPDGQTVEARVGGSAQFALGDDVTVTAQGPVLAFPARAALSSPLGRT